MSGFLFNHNSTIWGGNVETLASFTSEQTISENSIQPIKLDEQMTRILAEINSANDSNETNYRLTPRTYPAADPFQDRQVDAPEHDPSSGRNRLTINIVTLK